MSEAKTEDVVGCLLAPVILPLNSIIYGWTVSVLWRWFFVSTFHVKPIGIPAAIGCALMISLITRESSIGDRPAKEYREESSTWELLLISPTASLLTLGVGWIVHLFM